MLVKFVRKEAMPMTQTLLIRNIRPAGGQVTNVLIRDGYIVSIGGASLRVCDVRADVALEDLGDCAPVAVVQPGTAERDRAGLRRSRCQ